MTHAVRVYSSNLNFNDLKLSSLDISLHLDDDSSQQPELNGEAA